jgi:peroxiredoxin
LYDHHNHKRSLKELLEKGPVVLVFYYGYFCDHCVSQLFALQADIKYFHDLGAEVVAISPDTPEITRERYKEYGAFDFPVLSDPDNKVAELFGVNIPPESDGEALAASGASAAAIAGAPLAFDPLLAASALYPGRPRRERVQYHGTYVIDREGRVQWGFLENVPFTSNRTLLYKLAELEDKLPAKDN